MNDFTPYQLAFVQKLCASNVEFLVVGGMALRAHGLNRQTKDLDLFVSRSRDNAEKLSLILTDLLPHLGQRLSSQMLMQPEKLIGLPVSLPKEATEVDILTSVGALNFELCFYNRQELFFSDLALPVLGLSELLYSKLFSAQRTKCLTSKARDLQDISDITIFWEGTNRPKVNSDVAQ